MEVVTKFYSDESYWIRLDEMFNNYPRSFYLFCKNHGSTIVVCVNDYLDPPRHLCIFVQVGFWTLEYQIQ